MLKVLLMLCLLVAHVEAVAYAENDILCYVNSAGEIIYSDRECPDGYFLVNGMLELSTVPSRAKEAYTPIVPVESTVDVAPLFSEPPAVEVKKETIIYYDENGNLTMVFNDGLAHGREWGYFNRRYYGLYRCGSGFRSRYSYCTSGIGGSSFLPRAHLCRY
ncbi:MAG: hypothetical protein KAG92_09295 [Deltaproteobacteria bacterium]|nr:hypothetical protein [Deltaproteobacteria bacterium]